MRPLWLALLVLALLASVYLMWAAGPDTRAQVQLRRDVIRLRNLAHGLEQEIRAARAPSQDDGAPSSVSATAPSVFPPLPGIADLFARRVAAAKRGGKGPFPVPAPLAFLHTATEAEASVLKRAVDRGSLFNTADYTAEAAAKAEAARGGGGPNIYVTSAAVVCNCPALSETAAGALEKRRHDAYIHSYPFSQGAGDVEGIAEITALAAAACNGKPTCEYTLSQDSEMYPVPGCPGKLMVDYLCAADEAEAKRFAEGKHPPVPRFAALHNPSKGQKVALSCSGPFVPSTPERAGRKDKRVMWVKPVTYRDGSTDFDVWPIQFSIPEHRFVGAVGWKHDRHKGGFAPSIPGNRKTYKFHSQDASQGEPDTDYLSEYKRAYFCVTRKKKGWDALRHYEILSQGCVPYFIDLDRMPEATMPFFPKELVLQAMRLPGVNFKDDKGGSFLQHDSYTIDWAKFDLSRYYELAAKIHHHSKRYLTSHAMAQYILNVLEAEGGPKAPKRVLYVNHCYHDFLDDSVWSGLKELEIRGILTLVADIVAPVKLSAGGPSGGSADLARRGECKNGRKVAQMSSEKTLLKSGFYHATSPIGWGTHRPHNEFPAGTAVDPVTLPDRIRKKEFDVVIYGTAIKTLAWIDEVREVYPANAVAILTGQDSAELVSTYRRLSQLGTLFVRELYDDPNGVPNPTTCADAPGTADAQGYDCCTTQYGGSRTVWTSGGGDAWKKCASEGGMCECQGQARFGDPRTNQWSQVSLPEKRTVKCTNINSDGPFVDPAIGRAKQCQCLSI